MSKKNIEEGMIEATARARVVGLRRRAKKLTQEMVEARSGKAAAEKRLDDWAGTPSIRARHAEAAMKKVVGEGIALSSFDREAIHSDEQALPASQRARLIHARAGRVAEALQAELANLEAARVGLLSYAEKAEAEEKEAAEKEAGE